jgi:hypothetical protein
VICYINVRHAGSAFVVRKLLGGLKVADLVSAQDPQRFDVTWSHVQANVYDRIRAVMRLAKGSFTTFRTGIDDSCARRKEDAAVLGREKQLLFDLMCEFDILPLHLEIPGRRDEELAEINRKFGLSLATDWVRVPSMGGTADNPRLPRRFLNGHGELTSPAPLGSDTGR